MTNAKTILLAAALLLLAVLPAISQDDEMTIGGEDYGFEQPTRPGVLFTHTKHMELEMIDGACLPCHHDGKDDGIFVEGDPVPCKDCHAPGESSDEVLDLRTAYHKQCIDCHQAAGEGPITCGECHVQKDFFGMPLGDDAEKEKAEHE